jgi:ATP-binding cassette subfamily B protein
VGIILNRTRNKKRYNFFIDAEKSKNTKYTLKNIWVYFQKEKKRIFLVIVVVVLSTILSLLGPYLIAIALDDYILKGDIKGLSNIVYILILIYIVGAFFSWVESYYMIVVSQNIVYEIRNNVFRKLQELSIKYFDTGKKGDIISRLTNDIENISNTLNQTLIQMIKSILGIFGTIIFMFFLSWQLTIVTMMTIPMVIIMVKLISTSTGKYFRSLHKMIGEINNTIEEDITGIKLIKAYVKEEEKILDFNVKNERLRINTEKAQFYSGLMGPGMNFISNIRFTTVVGFGMFFNMLGIVSIGIITSFISYSRQFGRPLSQLAQLYNEIQKALAGAERVFEIMDLESEYSSEEKEKFVKLKGKVKFENVSFYYENDREILKNINFEVEAGESVALVGPTGAGKTTILNLLFKFYDFNSGCIYLDNTSIKDIDRKAIRRRLGIVLQDTYLFSGSIKDNIKFGNLNASDEEIIEASKMSKAHEFIKKLPYAYDTEVSENGGNLSEGQRQLIAITRAILADHDIIVLDEATSNVDTQTEKNIKEALKLVMKGKTSFIIAHRLSTIKNADKIIVIKDGRVEEIGNHKKLIENKGFYWDLYTSQFRKSL